VTVTVFSVVPDKVLYYSMSHGSRWLHGQAPSLPLGLMSSFAKQSGKIEEDHMAFCPKCGKEAVKEGSFCQGCGAKLPVQGGGPQGSVAASHLQESDYRTFIGKNADKYVAKFGHFSSGGEGSFAATWHWPAFFVPFFWMLYRKMYFWALLVFVIGAIPFAWLVMMPVIGLTGNYMYFNHARKKMAEAMISSEQSEVQRAVALARAGGVNSLIVILPVVLVPIIAILAAIAIPQFAAYRQRAFDMQAKSHVQNACYGVSAFFQQNPDRAEIDEGSLSQAGYTPLKDVELTILDPDRETFSLSARHVRGRSRYVAKSDCTVTEVREQ
jgi:Tfp pilus assembly protein PilE